MSRTSCAAIVPALALMLHSTAAGQLMEPSARDPSTADAPAANAPAADASATGASADGTPGGTAPAPGARAGLPSFRVGAGVLEQFNSSLDNGGRYGATRAYATAGANLRLSETLDLRIPVGFEYSNYRFRGEGAFESAPWSEVYSVGFAPRLSVVLTEQWSITAGPVIDFSGERGADIGDSIQWGGVGAVRYAFDREHVLGLGVLVLTQFEDDPLVLPLPLVDWSLGDGWSISNVRGPEANPFTGLEVVKTLDAGWEVAAGAAYVTRRFRLNNTGPVPGGIGGDSDVPLFARLTCRPHPAFRVDLVAGVSVLNRVTLDDSSGNRITASDADPSPLLGLFASLRF